MYIEMTDLLNFTSSYKSGLIDPRRFPGMWLQVISMGGGQRDQLEMPKGAATFFGDRKDVNIFYDTGLSENCRVSLGGDNEMGEINLPSGKDYPGHMVIFNRLGTLDDGFQMLYTGWDSAEAETIRELSAKRFRLQGKGRQIGFLGDLIDDFVSNELSVNIPVINSLVNAYTERTRKERNNQNRFRRGQDKIWNYKCPFSHVEHYRLLRASHAKPWRFCETGEHLNPYNGFLLSANLDAAFDEGLFTISDTGVVIFSPQISNDDIVRLGFINLVVSIQESHKPFLEYHRNNVFKRV